MHIRENVPLAPMTTLKIGGPARFFALAETEQHVVDAFRFADENKLAFFVLGGGSNILVSDNGFDGLVIQIGLKGVALEDRDGVAILTAGAGEDWEGIVALAVDRNLAGFECLGGIPGSAGGTPVQNVGAYGQEVSESIVSVRCFDRTNSATVELANADCGFSYRRSIFNSTERGRYVVLSVTYKLIRNGPPKIAYKDLIETFKGREPSLAEAREAVLKIRRSKSMVIDAADPNSRSAGSFFKNPIVDLAAIREIKSITGTGNIPSFPVSETTAKVPAAWLIENSGFGKGFRLGNAGLSANHSLALVNFGGASAAEMIKLKELIQSRVEEKFGICLEPEPIFVGF
ncbi:MAG: UDP-N-acetylmuramate dehydrogenase [Acidobacteriota bacterium]